MKATALHPSQSPPAGIADEARALYARMQRDTFVRTDRTFGLLMILQWLAGIVLAFVVSPRTWIGEASATHLHVYAAVLLGGLISLVPAALAFRRPGAPYTRYAIAAGQVLTSGLLIHLTGGRIETHFHIFASLGLLAAYRDWKVVIVAAAVTAADHLVRGLVYPESVFGVTTADVWRVVEHAWWVVFMVVFLLKTDRESVKEQRALAETQARANAMNAQNEELLRNAEAQQARLTEQSTELQEAMTVLDTQQRYLQENVELMLRQMAAFADGNLAVHLPTDREGAIRTLFEGFNQAVQNIRETLDHVNQIVETTAASASQISSFTEELAAASQQQSAQAQEVAAAVEEMARTIVDNAQNASRTAAVAQENGRQAQEGSEVVRLTVEKISRIADVVRSSGQTIERLGDSSQEIGEII
ncbi:MAG: methyl-accepting chemotaxis protein, partial [Bacteroidetes bacterium]